MVINMQQIDDILIHHFLSCGTMRTTKSMIIALMLSPKIFMPLPLPNVSQWLLILLRRKLTKLSFLFLRRSLLVLIVLMLNSTNSFGRIWEIICFPLLLIFFKNVVMPKAWGRTYIVLIPKKEHPKFALDFRLIFLCNVSYKIVTKILANHLKSVIEFLIDSE